MLIHSKDDNLTTHAHDSRRSERIGRGHVAREIWPQQLDAIDGIVGERDVDRGVATVGGIDGHRVCVFRRHERRAGGAGAQYVLHRFDRPATIGVNDELKGISNAGKFAASLGGIGEDSRNAERLAAFLDQPLESAGNASLSDMYNQLLNEITQGSSIAQSVAEGFRVFEGTLEGQQQAVSGVSIDEEAIKMITLQRIYQASAKYIQTISELLDMLVNL